MKISKQEKFSIRNLVVSAFAGSQSAQDELVAVASKSAEHKRHVKIYLDQIQKRKEKQANRPNKRRNKKRRGKFSQVDYSSVGGSWPIR
tara:strand:+ start:1388 stop:1654 length:267 start_codon:yes stop_codon:yes gene_type:complete